MSKVLDLVTDLTGLTTAEFDEVKKLILEQGDGLAAEPTTLENAAALNAAASAGEAVIAAAGRGGAVRRMAAARAGKPLRGSPERSSYSGRATLVASGNLRGIGTGDVIVDRDRFATALAATLSGMDRKGPRRGNVIVASATWDYDETRRLRNDDAYFNNRLIEAVTSDEALVASGGICSPGNVDYSIESWADASRPVRDGLAQFSATRGLVRFVQPPVITSLAGATGVWTAAMDVADNTTKALLKVTCGSVVEVPVAAVSTRLGFGNMMGRFAPEQVAVNTDLAIAAAARIAENNLLALIQAQCTLGVTNTVTYGATRDLIETIEQVVSNLRNTYRVPKSTPFTAILPDWLKGILKIDLARETAHDNASDFNVLAITDDQVDALLKAHGVNAIWHLDGQAASAAGGNVYPLQLFTAQTGGAAIQAFPTKVVWYVYPEGSFQFLDGGRLDLGVVRDSVLDATNDYETFVETFEGVAYRGFPGSAVELITTLCASGGSAGTVASAGNCA